MRTPEPLLAEGGERTRRRGEFAVKPVRPITVDGETLSPSTSRLSPRHPWVIQRPELFTPCRTDDEWTRAVMRANVRAAIRQLERTPTRSTSPTPGSWVERFEREHLRPSDDDYRPLRLPS
jgi:hypothetical protein